MQFEKWLDSCVFVQIAKTGTTQNYHIKTEPRKFWILLQGDRGLPVRFINDKNLIIQITLNKWLS